MRHGRRWPPVLVAVAGVVCLGLGGALLAVDASGSPDLGGVAVAGPPAPAAAPQGVPPVLPRAGTVPVVLELPGRAVTAPVVPVSTGVDGGLVIPDPPSTVGWWSPSALPGGTRGTTVIAGHVDSRTDGLGALSVLRSVQVGEPILLRGSDGRTVDYRVAARRQYLKADLPPEIFDVGGPPRLVLITCGGRFDRATRQYSDNVVVDAVPV